MKKIAIMMAILLMAGTASAALLQGTNHCYSEGDGGSKPGTYEYDCIHVWGHTRCVQMTGDGSGIVGYLGQTEVTPLSMHQSGNANSDGWQAEWWNTRDGGTMGYNNADDDFVIYDMGSSVTIATAYLWAGSQNDHADVSIRDFSIEVGDAVGGPWTSVTGGLTLAQHPTPGGDIPAQTFAIATPTAGQFIRINVASAWHPKGWAGLSEAAFAEGGGGGAAVPEPAGLGLVGIALLGLRKRRS